MSDRFTGAKAVQVRQQPVPWAYRVFFRQIGIDPDERRTPAEAVALERMRVGAFQSQNLLDDALLIATVETGVPLLAFDARPRGAATSGSGWPGPASASATRGERCAAARSWRRTSAGPLCVLFGDPAPDRGVTPATGACS